MAAARDEYRKGHKNSKTLHEELTEQIYFEIKWLQENQTQPTNYLIVIVVSMLSSALVAWLFTH